MGRVGLGHSHLCKKKAQILAHLDKTELQREEERNQMMRGVGGPLLCIGDLLSDVGEESDASPPPQQHEPSLASSVSNPTENLDLTKLFQENYEKLNEALNGTDHSWAALTLKLCSALETANKLVQETNTNVMAMSEKVGELEEVIKRGDSAVASARIIHASLNKNEGPVIGNQNLR